MKEKNPTFFSPRMSIHVAIAGVTLNAMSLVTSLIAHNYKYVVISMLFILVSAYLLSLNLDRLENASRGK